MRPIFAEMANVDDLREPFLSLRRRADRHRELAHALDLAFELVAGDRRSHAGGRSGHDDVAGRELDHLAELYDHLRYVPDHLREIAVLAHLAVGLERDAALARMSNLAGGLQRPARRGGIECLADLPWPLHVARGDLQVAAGEVDAGAVAPDAVERL